MRLAGEKGRQSAEKSENGHMFTLRMFEGAFNLILESAIEIIFVSYFKANGGLITAQMTQADPGVVDMPCCKAGYGLRTPEAKK